MTKTIPCRSVIESLPEYVDGGLAPERREALLHHVRVCPPCGPVIESYAAIPRITREILAEPMPAERAKRLQAYLRPRLRNGHGR